MIIEYSKIINIVDNKMILSANKQSSCGKCNSCGFSNLEKAGKQKTITLTTDLIENAKIGDQAVLAIEENKILNLAFTTYIIPLLMLIACTIITSQLNISEPIKVFIILISTLVCLILVNIYNAQRLKKNIKFKVIKIISQ